jgi:Domain of unknown function (DUF4129)
VREVTGRRVPREGRVIVAVGVAAIGLALGIAATGAPVQLSSPPSIAKRLVIEVPVWLELVVLFSLGVASLLVLGLLVRARRKQPQDKRHYEPPQLTTTGYVFLTVLVLMPFALAAGVLWFSAFWTNVSDGFSWTTPEPLERTLEGDRIYSPGVSAIFGTFAIVISMGILGFMLWLYSGGWLLGRSGKPTGSVRTRLDGAVLMSLDDLIADGDARRSIIKCYGRFEVVLAAAHSARAPWQTPMEFMRSALQRYHLPRRAVWELTRLFELARFSEHSMGDHERQIAVSCLRSICEALQSQEVASAPDT